jgi:hypothetical protein
MPVCQDGQELNPVTNRCRKIVCKNREKYNKTKKKCVKEKCSQGKILNKLTNRCVKKTIKCKPREILDKQKNKCVLKKCEKGKVLNAKTMRCVKEKSNVTRKIKPRQIINVDHKSPKIKTPIEYNRSQMRPPNRNVLKEILDQYKTRSSKKVIPYICLKFVEHLMLLHVLKINKNDCSYDVQTFGDLSAGYKTMNYKKSFMKHIREHYVRCKKNNKLLVVPLAIMSGKHANVLIFNPHRNEVERFEPHGSSSGHRVDNEKINLKIKEFVEEVDSTLKYISPVLLCPRGYMGYQWYESDAKEETGKYKNVVITDPGGFCCAWSYFYVDMRLKFPEKSGTKIIKESQDILGKDPKQLRQFIRGQYEFLVTELNKIDKKYKFEEFVEKKQNKKLTTLEYMEYKDAWNDAIYKEFEKFHSINHC